ncbi:MAG: HEAT repeat domain-containing protein, partial [Bellilinea sp.]
IRAAYNKDDPEWLVTALFAMGRSANSTWIPSVMDMLDSENQEVLFEAVRAAGELEAKVARKRLLRIVKTQPEGSEIRMAGIWALSKIGGEKVRDTLEAMLESSEDDDEIDLLEDALENLQFTEGFNQFGLLDYEPESEEELALQEKYDEMDEDFEDDDLEDDDTDDDLDLGEDEEDSDS